MEQNLCKTLATNHPQDDNLLFIRSFKYFVKVELHLLGQAKVNVDNATKSLFRQIEEMTE